MWDKDNVAEKKAAEELEKEFVAVESKDVMKLTIDRGGNQVAAERDGEDWRIVDPVEWPGDKFAWKTIADNLASAKINRRFPDEGEDLTDKQLEMWGLAEPQLKLNRPCSRRVERDHPPVRQQPAQLEEFGLRDLERERGECLHHSPVGGDQLLERAARPEGSDDLRHRFRHSHSTSKSPTRTSVLLRRRMRTASGFFRIMAVFKLRMKI